jgi:hypothetical protein
MVRASPPATAASRRAAGRPRSLRAFIKELGKYLRVVTLADGETVHNAFPDRGFREEDR